MTRPVLWIALSALVAGCGSSNPDGSGGGGGGGSNAGLTAEQHCLDTLNKMRAQAGVPALQLDDKLNVFAAQGSVELAAGGEAHGHFGAAAEDGSLWTSGFCGGAAENQAPGWPAADVNATIDSVIDAMMGEGPGGGHHDNILNKDSRLVGVGLVVQDGKLYFTNDFSPACK